MIKNFAHCPKCDYYESDEDEPFQCDCPEPKREKHWLDEVVKRVKEIEDEN